jgi:PAS domain S-box-containing protein
VGALLEHSWDILSVLDAEGKLVYNSPAGERIHGFTESEFLGAPTFQFIHPEDQGVVGAVFAQVMANPGVPFTVRYRYARKGGDWIWMEAVGVNHLENPVIRGIVVNSRDISERHRSDAALLRSEALLAEAQALTGIGSFEVDLLRRESRWSESMNQFFHRDPALGPPHWEELLALVHPADRDGFAAGVRAALEGRERFNGDFRIIDPQGKDRHFSLAGRVQGDSSGRPIRIIGAVQEITQRVHTEKALRESLDRFRGLADFLPQTIFEMDLEGRLTFVNRWALQVFGYTEEDVQRGLTNLDVIVPEDRERALRATRENLAGAASGRQYHCLRKDGSRFPVMIHSAPILLEGRAVGLRGIIFDLTELKDAEAERDRLQERLRHSEKMEAIGQLAGGVAHDFNNQLSAIMGFADMLRESHSDPLLRKYAENIATACERSAELTKRLLAFARKGKYLSVPVDVNALVEEVIQFLGRSLEKRINLKVELLPGVVMTLGDPSQLQNALMNLALNARDAMPEGGILRFTTTLQDLDETQCHQLSPDLEPGNYVLIGVEDTGTGMSAEVLQRLFEPFFTTKERGKGTGLGLASVYGTIKNHRGAIAVESALGRGSRFTLALPHAPLQPEAAAEVSPEVPMGVAKRILVVEDEPLVGEMLSAMLRRLGYRVDLAADGPGALELFRRDWESIDLVILDLVMPRMSGRETFLALREIDPSVRVLLSSGYSVDGEAQQILDQGALGFIQKPYQSTALSQTLAEVLRSRE